jgi:hypothetical protein
VVFVSDNNGDTQVGQALNSNPTLSTIILAPDPYAWAVGQTQPVHGFRLCTAQFATGNNTKKVLVMLSRMAILPPVMLLTTLLETQMMMLVDVKVVKQTTATNAANYAAAAA